MSSPQPTASPARPCRTMTRPRAARPSTVRPSAINERCAALFASGLQASDTLAPDTVAQAIMHTLRRLGRQGCAGLMAQEFGDHPEVAGERMRWARSVVTTLPLASASLARRGRAELPC
jgi:hypothetical protein